MTSTPDAFSSRAFWVIAMVADGFTRERASARKPMSSTPVSESPLPEAAGTLGNGPERGKRGRGAKTPPDRGSGGAASGGAEPYQRQTRRGPHGVGRKKQRRP
ncbi:hypothetical protein AwMethylo_19180 [Methylobacterium sp.]|nr:hypothetical protein AwMethylo_19180 [Methylobacterium sp.]